MTLVKKKGKEFQVHKIKIDKEEISIEILELFNHETVVSSTKPWTLQLNSHYILYNRSDY